MWNGDREKRPSAPHKNRTDIIARHRKPETAKPPAFVIAQIIFEKYYILVNRAERAREYLSSRLRDFDSLRNMEDSKIAFFDAVIAFKESIIADLKKFKIIDLSEIENLEQSLGEIERCRGKGGGGYKVYHSTWIHFGIAQKQIIELMKSTSIIKVPFKYNLQDICASRPFIITMTAVFLTALLAVIIKKYF